MKHTALRPKPMPGQEPGGGTRSGGPGRRPHAARRRGRRLTTLLFGLFVGLVLVLSGVGLGTVGATVIGMSKLAELQGRPGQGVTGAPGAASAPAGPSPTASTGPASPSPDRADVSLGVEIVDADKSGAKIVAVHVPGPGYTAGLIRGDVLLMFGGARIDSATDLVRAVDEARPGREVTLTVRHRSGGYEQLVVVPGVVT